MNKKHSKFILERLIPFILREEGRGFGMESWRLDAVGGRVTVDGITRKAPPCGTVACIGGSIEALLPSATHRDTSAVGQLIGLSCMQAAALFYGWMAGDEEPGYRWPTSFAKRYARARTMLGKAKVAVALLQKVARTKGACLNA